ncbi:uncharacterized protein CANTADRAFT_76811 [Suhomyces tanzawaensis NRRL Y-17324]|uniref:Uncharacterized protein n=1 Tax=Suhomyces tanzawaensis NRRL Y-17324 TaxID=984487 RepID=A0A1E4SN51_9ASCO|nr:uncharacterized protein CANTADRAFT_76811 [Suhomyces tanzawaensis NRRL Y-17324]ODV80925.1 hypothetical protein CANTADRAFT_76811 [Suhomyces tanzawaensis NRRL Y-17324]
MVFSNFIKCSKCSPHDRLQFFQSSHPYLNNNSLINYRWFQNKRWTNPNPSSASQNYLTIDNGHYGLYYTVYNHDAERKKSGQSAPLGDTLLSFIITHEDHSRSCFDYATQFFILRINQDIYNNITQIKNISKKFLSAMSVITPKIRSFNPKHDCPPVAQLESTESETFESNFFQTQISSILDIYNNCSSPEQLNMIYPLYQSLKRNDITLPTIELYNVILHSISMRSLDSELTSESIESKLTNLLTIYQDILKSSLKPNAETFNIIVTNLFDGSINVSKLSSSSSNIFIHRNYSNKAKEFGQIGIELFESIQKKEQLNLIGIIPKLLEVLRSYPELVGKPISAQIVPFVYLPASATNQRFLENLIEFTKHFTRIGMFEGSSEKTYKFIVSVYEQYKESELKINDEFSMYGKLIESLVYNDQFVLASKFLDDILMDYKHSIENNIKPKKNQISAVISSYISAIINKNQEDLDKGYGLLRKFNGIGYLPELSNSLYNDMIVKYIDKYHANLMKKSNMNQMMPNSILDEEQRFIYENIWSLYNYMAIRRDYQETSTMNLIEESEVSQHARDSVLSLSIDVGDHERIFQVIKEILLKNHLVFDIIGFKKLLSYLYNGVVYNANDQPFNQYYFGLIWNLFECQSSYYNSSSIEINEFLSESVNFLMVPNVNEHTNEYNIKLFLESPIVQHAVGKFDLQSDNIFGLIMISKTLMQYRGNDAKTYNQILEFQSKLINQFEDIDNLYIEFAEDMLQHKADLLQQFKHLMSSLESEKIKLTDNIIDACKACDVEVLNEISEENLEHTMKYDLNLSYLLNVNYDVGIDNFIKSFRKGLTFNSGTWEIVLNYKFLSELTAYSSPIKISELIGRIWELRIDTESKVQHISTLINFKDDKINIKVTESLIKEASLFKELDSMDSVLSSLISAVSSSKNVYLKSLFSKVGLFHHMYSEGENGRWVAEYLKLLVKQGEFDECIQLIETFKLMETRNTPDDQGFQVTVAVLEAYLNSGNLQKFMSVFKNNFMDINILRKSPELVGLLITYYMKLGGKENIEVVLSKFSELSNASQQTKELFLNAKLVNSLQSEKVESVGEGIEAGSINELAMKLLISDDIKNMAEVFKANDGLIVNKVTKNRLVDSILDNLLQASAQATTDQRISNQTFQRALRFFKLISYRALDVKQLLKVIRILTINKSRETLNILLSKLVHNSSFASVLNFYFMEIRLVAEDDRILLLDLLKKSFTYLQDPINLHTIEKYCESSGLDLPCFTEEDFIKELH